MAVTARTAARKRLYRSGRRRAVSTTRWRLRVERIFDGAILASFATASSVVGTYLAASGYGAWALSPLISVAVAVTFVQMRRASRRRHRIAVALLEAMLEGSFEYTKGHLWRVCELAQGLGKRMGFGPLRLASLSQAAFLHDIGKVACDEAILDKPSRLTAEEYEHIKAHCEHSTTILADCSRLGRVRPLVHGHHERPDGQGYPRALVDGEIPLESKIIAVVDAYDSMVGGPSPEEQRSFRLPMTPEAALEELRACSGTQFDPYVVAAFEEMLREARTI